jgi:hypothetical protein
VQLADDLGLLLEQALVLLLALSPALLAVLGVFQDLLQLFERLPQLGVLEAQLVGRLLGGAVAGGRPDQLGEQGRVAGDGLVQVGNLLVVLPGVPARGRGASFGPLSRPLPLRAVTRARRSPFIPNLCGSEWGDGQGAPVAQGCSHRRGPAAAGGLTVADCQG